MIILMIIVIQIIIMIMIIIILIIIIIISNIFVGADRNTQERGEGGAGPII